MKMYLPYSFSIDIQEILTFLKICVQSQWRVLLWYHIFWQSSVQRGQQIKFSIISSRKCIGLSKSAQTFTVGFVKLLPTHPIHIVVWGNFPFNWPFMQLMKGLSIPGFHLLWKFCLSVWNYSGLMLTLWTSWNRRIYFIKQQNNVMSGLISNKKKTRKFVLWDQVNYFVIMRDFYISSFYNEIPLYIFKYLLDFEKCGWDCPCLEFYTLLWLF